MSSPTIVVKLAERYPFTSSFWGYAMHISRTREFNTDRPTVREFAELLEDAANSYEHLRATKPEIFSSLPPTGAQMNSLLIAAMNGFVFNKHLDKVRPEHIVPVRKWILELPELETRQQPVKVAMAVFSQKLNHVVRARYAYLNSGERIISRGNDFLVQIMPTTLNNVIVEKTDGSSVHGSWNCKILTGEHRGEEGYVHSPAYNESGAWEERGVALHRSLGGDCSIAPLSEAHIRELIFLDYSDHMGKEVSINCCTVYGVGSSSNAFLTFEIPVSGRVAVVPHDTIDHRIRIGRLDDGSVVGDVTVDLLPIGVWAKDHAHVQSMGTSYHSDGRIIHGEFQQVPEIVPCLELFTAPTFG